MLFIAAGLSNTPYGTAGIHIQIQSLRGNAGAWKRIGPVARKWNQIERNYLVVEANGPVLCQGTSATQALV